MDTAYRDGKRLVIYTFAARMLTEFDSWKVVPLKR